MPYTLGVSAVSWDPSISKVSMTLDIKDDTGASINQPTGTEVTYTFALGDGTVLYVYTPNSVENYPMTFTIPFTGYTGTSEFKITPVDSGGMYEFVYPGFSWSGMPTIVQQQAPQAPVNTPPKNSGGAICFFGNAPVLTPAGYRRMDSLRAGDKVTTPNGGTVAIEAVKIMRCAAGPETNPYVIPKGEFGATKRVLISPRHRVATAKGMVEAQHLGLAQEERTGTLTYYNLALPGWANMIVAGVEVESLAPVKRVTVPLSTFKALVEKNYGGFTPAVLANIQKTCRFMPNGEVECPVMRR